MRATVASQVSWIKGFYGITSLREFRRRVPDEETARRLLEALVWPSGPVCPRGCGNKTRPIRGPRPGLHECCRCRRQFTATTRTPLHGTKLPIRIWLEAIYLVLMSSKGVSSVVLGRQLGISQAAAWKMGHAIRLMMRPAETERLTGVVEVDTIMIGGDPRKANIRRYGAAGRHIHNPRGKGSRKPKALVAVERTENAMPDEKVRAGRARATPVKRLSGDGLKPALQMMVDRSAVLHSDSDDGLTTAGAGFAGHKTVVHSRKQYVDDGVHSNTAEGFNSTIRRAYIGVWHYWSEVHGFRYLEELGFRASQRFVIRRPRTIGGKTKLRNVSLTVPVVEQMTKLFANALGREMRRTPLHGIKEIQRTAPSAGTSNTRSN